MLFEPLEQRKLLTVSADVTAANGNLSIEFSQDGDTDRDIYLQTNANHGIEWSKTGTAGSFTQLIDLDVDDFQTILIEANSKHFDSVGLNTFDTLGADLDVRTSNKIVVTNDAAVSTRDLPIGATGYLLDASEGDSGDLAFSAPKITVQSGGMLLAQADGAFASGAIELEAHDTTGWAPNFYAESKIDAGVTLTSAVIRGGQVTIDVRADGATQFSEDDPAAETTIDFLSCISFLGGYARSEANATVEIDNHSDAYIGTDADVDVGGDVAVVAFNENDTVNLAGDQLSLIGGSNSSGGTGVGGVVLYVGYENHVKALVKDGAHVDAGSMLVMARTDARNISIATQGGSADEFGLNGASTTVEVNNHTKAKVDDGAVLTIGAGYVEVPRDYDVVDMNDTSLFTNRPKFRPTAVYQRDDHGNETLYVDEETDTIALPYDHNFVTGQGVHYDEGGDASIGGLVSGSAYYAIVLDENSLQLAASHQDATAETPIPIDLNLTSTDGKRHSLYGGFDPETAAAEDRPDAGLCQQRGH